MPKLGLRRAEAKLAVLCCASLLLVACTSSVRASSKSAEDKPTVLTTFTVLADMARNVGGEHVRVESITKVGAEIHGYEPTASDLRRASGADLILDNGLGLEAWFQRFVEDVDAPHVVVSDGVRPVPIAEDAYAGRPNPHAWMSPTAGVQYVRNITRALVELDPAHAADYRRNAERYTARLRDLQEELVTALDRLPEDRRALVTCEGAFSYLARDAGLQEKYLWPVNAEQQATPQRLAAVVDFVRERRVAAVFCESTVSPETMLGVADTGRTRFGGTLYVDSLSGPDGPVPTYLDLLRHDVDTIVQGLSVAPP
jgi:manganese transport system substrate-binding protein